jgi:hypothetical protein
MQSISGLIMKIIKVLTVVIVMALLVMAGQSDVLVADEKERLPDMKKLLIAYNCMEKRKNNYGSYVDTKVSLRGDTDDITSIEGMKDLIDTPEEFITASFYNDIPVVKEARDIIQKELPQGKTGALRLASLWLKKNAEDENNYRKYRTAINIIKKKSDLSNREIKNYYDRAIENEIQKIAVETIGDMPAQKMISSEICTPIIHYYTEPGKINEENLVAAGAKLFNENRLKADGFINILIKLNDRFAEKIINRIHNARLKK